MDFGEGLTNAWSSVIEFVPRFVAFLVVLAIGYFVAKAVSTLCNKALDRVGFDRAVERGGIRKVMQKSKYEPSDLLAKVVFYGVMLFVLNFAFGFFGQNNPVTQGLNSIIAYLPKVIAAGLIIVIASAVGAAVREIADSFLGSRSYGTTLANVCGAVFVAVGIFAALDQLSIASTITNAIFYAILGTLSLTTVVAVGGAGIKPMQKVWEQSIDKVSSESEAIRKESGDASSRLADRARSRAAQAKEAAGSQRSNRQDQDVDVREQPVSTAPNRDVWTEERNDDPRSGRRPQGF